MGARSQTPLVAELRERMLAGLRGCTIRPFGLAWSIRGPGVDVLIADFSGLKAADLDPVPSAADAFEAAR